MEARSLALVLAARSARVETAAGIGANRRLRARWSPRSDEASSDGCAAAWDLHVGETFFGDRSCQPSNGQRSNNVMHACPPVHATAPPAAPVSLATPSLPVALGAERRRGERYGVCGVILLGGARVGGGRARGRAFVWVRSSAEQPRARRAGAKKMRGAGSRSARAPYCTRATTLTRTHAARCAGAAPDDFA